MRARPRSLRHTSGICKAMSCASPFLGSEPPGRCSCEHELIDVGIPGPLQQAIIIPTRYYNYCYHSCCPCSAGMNQLLQLTQGNVKLGLQLKVQVLRAQHVHYMDSSQNQEPNFGTPM